MAAFSCVPDLGTLVCATSGFNEDAVDGYVQAARNDFLYVLDNVQKGDESGWLYVGTVAGRRGWIPSNCVEQLEPPLHKDRLTKLSRALSY